jgi:hypothetical protein
MFEIICHVFFLSIEMKNIKYIYIYIYIYENLKFKIYILLREVVYSKKEIGELLVLISALLLHLTLSFGRTFAPPKPCLLASLGNYVYVIHDFTLDLL